MNANITAREQLRTHRPGRMAEAFRRWERFRVVRANTSSLRESPMFSRPTQVAVYRNDAWGPRRKQLPQSWPPSGDERPTAWLSTETRLLTAGGTPVKQHCPSWDLRSCCSATHVDGPHAGDGWQEGQQVGLHGTSAGMNPRDTRRRGRLRTSLSPN